MTRMRWRCRNTGWCSLARRSMRHKRWRAAAALAAPRRSGHRSSAELHARLSPPQLRRPRPLRRAAMRPPQRAEARTRRALHHLALTRPRRCHHAGSPSTPARRPCRAHVLLRAAVALTPLVQLRQQRRRQRLLLLQTPPTALLPPCAMPLLLPRARMPRWAWSTPPWRIC